MHRKSPGLAPRIKLSSIHKNTIWGSSGSRISVFLMFLISNRKLFLQDLDKVHGATGPWIHRSMDPWIHGSMDPGIHEDLENLQDLEDHEDHEDLQDLELRDLAAWAKG